MGLLKQVFNANERDIARLRRKVDRINALESQYESMSDDELKSMTPAFRERLANGEKLDNLLPEAFAVMREAAKRVFGQRHYDVQLMGGIVLHEGRVAEMKTGEGKTLVATLPSYLNGLTGEGVHVVTVNDYLAKRDADFTGQVHRFMGLTVGYNGHDMTQAQKREAYAADITYGTNNEFGFDYLRDNMVMSASDMVQRKLHFAIVDEVDSILIDEARTPLIISGPAEKSADLYFRTDLFVRRLRQGEDYEIDEKMRTANLTDQGVAKAEAYFRVNNLFDPDNVTIMHHITQALKAHGLMHRDQDYVVIDDEICIVDEFTGRLMEGRRYSEGLHQAIEAKEGVRVQNESKTLATITLQNYFRMYEKLSGMTGTAKTEEKEFIEIYGMDVVCIPTNRPLARKDLGDVTTRPSVPNSTRWSPMSRSVTRSASLCWSARPTSTNLKSSRISSGSVAFRIRCSTPSTMRARPRSWQWLDRRAWSPSRRTWPDAVRTSCSVKVFQNLGACTLSARSGTKAAASIISCAVVPDARAIRVRHSSSCLSRTNCCDCSDRTISSG